MKQCIVCVSFKHYDTCLEPVLSHTVTLPGCHKPCVLMMCIRLYVRYEIWMHSMIDLYAQGPLSYLSKISKQPAVAVLGL